MINIYRNDPEAVEKFLSAERSVRGNVESLVASIIADVAARGDEALTDYTERLDGIKLTDFKVKKSEIDNAVAQCGERYMQILREAAANISLYHKKQRRQQSGLRNVPFHPLPPCNVSKRLQKVVANYS